MKKELFIPYRDMIARCIDSCKHSEQLFVCHDMMDRFREQFLYLIDNRELADAIDHLSSLYLQKQAELG